MKKVLAFVLACMLLCTALPAFAAGSLIEDVWLECEVVAKGHKMKAFHLTVTDPAVFETISKNDFQIIGQASNWGTTDLHTFTADIGSIKIDGNTAILTVINFNEKYFYVDNFTVVCNNARLTFTKEDLSKEFTPVVDEFEKFRVADGATLNYNLFTPADTTTAQPLVLALHGAGDYENLLQNRVATHFAEPYPQSVRPCYVLAPIFQNMETGERADASEVLNAAVDVIQGLIDEGKVDGNRVYVTGKSMGGGNTLRAIYEHPDFFAAAIPMCPAAGFLKDADYTPLLNQKIWIVHNDGDTTVKPEGVIEVYDKLIELGAKNVKMRLFTAQEMNALGYDEYHAVDMQVHANEIFYEWLFAQTKGE